ncbi:lipoprotein NlpI [Aeromonas sp. RU39B]|uniref:lipoprotein NlpI n=1 Tax=Aeromonas sp. RU39B TaxID=1907416 RepID=UPI000955FECB|nr:lipoprotein NlpI [Aeromonas sp. RU39B]SIQ85278.1 lipoprotein NlpI [Aeromonas sp. RU39B]
MSNWKGIRYLLGILLVLPIMGCSSTREVDAPKQPPKPEPTSLILATPLQVSYQSELALARLGQMLSEMELTKEQRAELFYERAVVFDRVGLRSLARLDFTRALREKPDFAEAYNFIGVYLVQQQNYDEAYEAFDSALELAPDYDYAYLNRGIALYYGNRPDLAAADIKRFFEAQPEDPYRVLWLYIAESKLDGGKALVNMRQRFDKYHDSNWNWDLVRLYLGELTSTQLMGNVVKGVKENRELAERLCETYFYLGKLELMKGNRKEAIAYFKLALANNVYDFIEHRYSLLELEIMARKRQAGGDATVKNQASI